MGISPLNQLHIIMASYFDQLAEDIRAAAKNNKPEGDQPIPDALVPNEWRKQYPHAEYVISRPLRNWFGLKKEMFPPADYWDEEQLEFMVQILTHLYWHFSFEPMLYHPYSDDPLPYEEAYDALIEGFDVIQVYYEDNRQPIYFCERNRDTCPFGDEYCYCRDH